MSHQTGQDASGPPVANERELPLLIFALNVLPFFFTSHLASTGSTDKQAPLAVESISSGGQSWEPELGVSSSVFASPLQLELILKLRSLNRAWHGRLNVISKFALRRPLLKFNNDGPLERASFRFCEAECIDAPPTKQSEARRLGQAFDFSADSSGLGAIIARNLMATGLYNPGYPGGTSVKFTYSTSADVPKSSEADGSLDHVVSSGPAALLGETALGKLLLQKLTTLQDMREQYECDSLQPLDKHVHLCRCLKLLILALHKLQPQFVCVEWKSQMSFENMGSTETVSNLYIERETKSGDRVWTKIDYRSSFNIEM
jgi:hypothetical protein